MAHQSTLEPNPHIAHRTLMYTPSPSRLRSVRVSLRLAWFLVGQDGREHCHCLNVDFRRHWLIRLSQLRQQLEVVDVEGWRRCEEDFGLFIARIAKSVWCPDRNNHIVANLCIYDLLVFTLGGGIGYVEADSPLSDVKCFIVHLTDG